MTTTYTKDDLRKIYSGLQRTLPPGGKPLTPEEVVDVNALLDKTRAMIAVAAVATERGRKVLEWRIPGVLALTMNEYSARKANARRRWSLGAIVKELDRRLLAIVEATPGARVPGSRVMRWARITRFTVQPNRIDDPKASDAIGGKMPIDALVRCGVLADDTPAMLRREAGVAKTKRGNTHLLVEVFEVAAEEVPCGPPVDAIVEQVVWVKGKLTLAITGEKSE